MKRILSIVLAFACFCTMLVVTMPMVEAATGTLSGWEFSVPFGTEKLPKVTFSIDKTVKASGENSLKIVYDNSQGGSGNARASIWLNKLTQGKSYRLGYKIKADKASNVAITLDSNPGFGWSNFTTDYGSTFDWKSVEAHFKFNKNANMCRYVIEIRGACEGLWVDDFYCYEYDGEKMIGENLASNPGIENLSGCTLPVISGEQQTEKIEVEGMDFSRTAFLTRVSDMSIDGNPDDWSDVPAYKLKTYEKLMTDVEQTIEADTKYAFDDDYFYIAAEVTDDVFVGTNSADGYWNFDSIQLAWNSNENAYLSSGVFYKDGVTTTAGMPEGALAEVSQNGEKTFYEVAIPWRPTFANIPEIFRPCILINDNDYDGRRGWLELTQGIGRVKDGSYFPRLYTKTDFLTAEIATDGIVQQSEATGIISIASFYDTDKQIDLLIKGKEPETLTLPAKSILKYVFEETLPQIGYHTIEASVTDCETGEIYTVEGNISRAPANEEVDSLVKKYNGYVAEIEDLLEKCQQKELNVKYEKSTCTIMELTIPEIATDTKAGNYDRVVEYIDSIERFYADLKARLNSYLDGSSKPLEVPKIIYTNTTFKNGRFYSYEQTEDGLKEVPSLLLGISGHDLSMEMFERFDDLGFNVAEVTLYPLNVVKAVNKKVEPILPDPNYKSDYLTMYEAREWLQTARENNQAFFLLAHELGASGTGSKIADDFTEPKLDENSYMKHNITHPVNAEIADVLMWNISENLYKDFKDVLTVLEVNNETDFRTNWSLYYRQYWNEFLRERYDNDIEKLNECYGTDYKKFSEVVEPHVVYDNVLMRDTTDFREGVMQDWIDMRTAAARRYMPDVPLAHKQMYGIRYSNHDAPRVWGTKHEKNAASFDINCCDTGGTGEEESLIEQLLWFDYMKSVKNVGNMDTEAHLIGNFTDTGKVDYSELLIYRPTAELWMQYIHGVIALLPWYLPSTHEAFYNSDLLQRPKTFNEITKLAIDVTRLTDELVMIQDEKAAAAMLWADSSFVLQKDSFNSLNQGYYPFYYDGVKVHTLVESQLEKLDEYDFLLVPNSVHVRKETLDAIKKFVDRGGRLVVVGENSLSLNEYAKPHDKQTVDAILDKADIIEASVSSDGTILNVPDDYLDRVHSIFEEEGLIDIEVIDKATGKRVENTSLDYVEKDGRRIANIHYSVMDPSQKVEVEVYINGVKQKNMYDLKGNKAYTDTIVLEALKPVLLEFGKGEVSNNEDTISVTLNGEKLEFDVAPVMENDRVLVPMRTIFEALDAQVQWDNETQTAVAKTRNDTLSISIDSRILKKNDTEINLDVPARLKNQRTLVPVRAISEAFNCDVQWDDATKTVIIMKK